MKKLSFFLGLVLIVSMFSTFESKAQSNNENVVTLSVTNLFVITPTVYYERVLGEKTSAKMGLYYTVFKASDTKMSGLGLIPEFRFYPGSKGAPKGFFLAPFFKYQNYSVSAGSEKASMSGIGGGLCIGAQFGDDFIFDMFVGPSFASFSTKYEGAATEDDFSFKLGSGVGLRFGMSVGFGF